MDYWMLEPFLWNSAFAGNLPSGTCWRTLSGVWGKTIPKSFSSELLHHNSTWGGGFAIGSWWLLGVSRAKAREVAYFAGAGHGEATFTSEVWLVSCWNQEAKPLFCCSVFPASSPDKA